MRLLHGRRRVAGWIALGLIGAASAVVIWWAASQPEEVPEKVSDLARMAHFDMIAVLLTTPIRDDVANLAQMTFGYSLLRFAAYALIAFCKVTLPAIAAGSIASDRRAGRLQDLQMTPMTATALYLATALAAALPYLLLGTTLLALFLGVVVGEFVPVSEAGRLFLEAEGQVLMTAFVAITCSALFGSPWVARIAAYFLLWLALPLVWLGILEAILAGSFWGIQISNEYRMSPGKEGFGAFVAAQALFTGIVCLLAVFLGVARLQPHGFRNWMRTGFQNLLGGMAGAFTRLRSVIGRETRDARHAGRPGV